MNNFFDVAMLNKGKTHLVGATWPYDSKPDAKDTMSLRWITKAVTIIMPLKIINQRNL